MKRILLLGACAGVLCAFGQAQADISACAKLNDLNAKFKYGERLDENTKSKLQEEQTQLEGRLTEFFDQAFTQLALKDPRVAAWLAGPDRQMKMLKLVEDLFKICHLHPDYSREAFYQVIEDTLQTLGAMNK